MKRYILIALALTAFSWSATAQNRAIKQLAENYSDKQGYTTIVLKDIGPGEELDIDLPELVDISRVMDGISSIIIVGSEHPDRQFANDVQAAVESGDYETLISVSQDGHSMKAMLARLPGNKERNELVMTVFSEENNLIISIVGSYKVKRISKSE
jgi:hypothetical protein